MNAKRKKICLISSSGGHYEQLKMLKPLGEKYDIFWVTERTSYKNNADYYVKQTGSLDKWFVFVMIGNSFRALRIFLKEKPDVIISTGTLIVLPFALIAKITRKKFIFIETFARVTDGTRAGKLIYKWKLADLFLYQWESLKALYPNGVYGGSIY